MNPSPAGPRRPALLAGAASGAAGLVVFLVAHHLWIMPIWFILPIGLPVALAAGAAVGWAYAELLPHLPGGWWRAPAVLAFIAIVLLPALILAELRAPMFDLSGPGGAVLLMSARRAAALFVLELLATATLAGAMIGWWLARTRRAAGASATAAFAFALGPGHNIPFGGGTPGVPLQIGIMALVAAVAAWTLVALLRRWSPTPAAPPAPAAPRRAAAAIPGPR